jgi:hypothetical protein
MAKIMPPVRQLQADAVNQDVPVAKLLRLAKVIATKLDQKDALQWIDRELDGYMNLKVDDMPAYRIVQGTPKAFNPYQGWRAIEFEDPEHARAFSKAPLGQPLGVIERDLQKGMKGAPTFPYPPETKKMLMDAMNIRMDVALFLSAGQLWGVIEAVRNLVLNWSLALEKAGVLGEEMTFTDEEKKEAGAVTQQFIIQNVGVLGTVGDQAKVQNKQIAGVALDIDEVADFARQALAALPQVPTQTRTKLDPVVNDIVSEAAKKKPDVGRLRGLLTSARGIGEGAMGNLAAAGIVQMITKLLGG